MWFEGEAIHEIATSFFKGGKTISIIAACKAIYKNLANTGTWGLAALSKMPGSGIDLEKLPETGAVLHFTLQSVTQDGGGDLSSRSRPS